MRAYRDHKEITWTRNLKLQLMATFHWWHLVSFRVVLKLLLFMQVDGLSTWLAEGSSKGCVVTGLSQNIGY